MKKTLILITILYTIMLRAEYVTGDHIPDMQFVDTNIDSTGRVLYSNQSTKNLITSGKVVVISFFGVG